MQAKAFSLNFASLIQRSRTRVHATHAHLVYHADFQVVASNVHDVLLRHVDELRKVKPDKLVRRRREKYLRMGQFLE